MNAAIKTAMVSALALAAAPAAAQYYGSPYRPTDSYTEEQRDYELQRQRYEQSREDYRLARNDYERRLAEWEAARAAYDARYGYGAYARAYGPAPVWDESRWAYAAPSAGYYGRNTSYTSPIRCKNNSAVTAGILGAIAGGVLGSNVAARNARTEGAVLGAVVGGGIGAAVGNANDRYRCDSRGPYFSYRNTLPYRISGDYPDERSDHYRRLGCRLAPAPIREGDYRYVRVCPDDRGRYRITG